VRLIDIEGEDRAVSIARLAEKDEAPADEKDETPADEKGDEGQGEKGEE
jgi:hypothetical protein